MTKKEGATTVYRNFKGCSRNHFPGCTRHRGKSTPGYIRELVQPTSLHQFQPSLAVLDSYTSTRHTSPRGIPIRGAGYLEPDTKHILSRAAG
jgi:hypothetical protein